MNMAYTALASSDCCRKLKHRLSILCLAVAIATMCVMAQDAETLKARFAAFFNTASTGRYAKIVWHKMRDNMRKPDVDPADILALDTKDGIIRTLVRSSSGAVYASSITWDGKRVIYYNNTTLTVHRINWDGTNDTVILRNWEGGGRCWQSPDGKQWALVTEFKGNGVMGAGLYRVNIDNPTERVLLLTCSSWSRVSWMGSTSWASMSVDGKYVAGGFPNYGALGTFAVRTPVPTSVRYLSPNGCWISISRDNTYRVLYTNDGTMSHKELYIGDTTGKVILRKSLVGTILKNPTDGFESLRWTSDPDYCTFWSGWYQGGQCDGRGTANPKIVRISDLQWVAIRDNCTTAEGNCDVWFYTETPSAATRSPTHLKRYMYRSYGNEIVYDCFGRTAKTKTHGVRIAFTRMGKAVRETNDKPTPIR